MRGERREAAEATEATEAGLLSVCCLGVLCCAVTPLVAPALLTKGLPMPLEQRYRHGLRHVCAGRTLSSLKQTT